MQIIGEYAGRVITPSQARQVWREHRVNYILWVVEHFATRSVATIVDASDPSTSNCLRYINHACEPNAFLHPIRRDYPFPPRIAVIAGREIGVDEEMVISYGDLTAGCSKVPCLCGGDQCRGWLPMERALLE